MAYLRKKGKNYFVTFYYRGRKYDKSCRTSQRPVAENIRKQIRVSIGNKPGGILLAHENWMKG